MHNDLPPISIIVTFRDNERCVLDCLRSISEMDYPSHRLEVFAINDSPGIETADLIRQQFPQVRLLQNDHPLGCDIAKQVGMDAATGEIIALTDADCMVNPHWAQAIAKNVSNGADAVTGPVKHPRTILRELIAIADFPDSQRTECCYTNAFPGCNFAIQHSLLHSTGFRSYGIQTGSDRLLSWQLFKAGYDIVYDLNMHVTHFPRADVFGMFERRFRYARTAVLTRRIDSSLPGGSLIRMGPLAGPVYLAFKLCRDAQLLLHLSQDRLINPWHTPILVPSLVLLRFIDSLGILKALFSDTTNASTR